MSDQEHVPQDKKPTKWAALTAIVESPLVLAIVGIVGTTFGGAFIAHHYTEDEKYKDTVVADYQKDQAAMIANYALCKTGMDKVVANFGELSRRAVDAGQWVASGLESDASQDEIKKRWNDYKAAAVAYGSARLDNEIEFLRYYSFGEQKPSKANPYIIFADNSVNPKFHNFDNCITRAYNLYSNSPSNPAAAKNALAQCPANGFDPKTASTSMLSHGGTPSCAIAKGGEAPFDREASCLSSCVATMETEMLYSETLRLALAQRVPIRSLDPKKPSPDNRENPQMSGICAGTTKLYGLKEADYFQRLRKAFFAGCGSQLH